MRNRFGAAASGRSILLRGLRAPVPSRSLGAARVLDLFGALNYWSFMRPKGSTQTAEEIDTDAMALDWRKVGEHLHIAIEKHGAYAMCTAAPSGGMGEADVAVRIPEAFPRRG